MLDILLTDKYATIESIHEVALPDDSENIIDSTGDIITRKKTDEGAFRYKVVGGVPIGGKRFLRITVKPQNDKAELVKNYYLLLKGA